MKKIKVLVIEKDVLARQVMASVLLQEDEYEVAGITSQRISSKRSIETMNPDVVLLSIEKKQSEEFELFLKLRVQFPQTAIILISPRTIEGGEVVVAALKMGAIDFITKPAHSTGLLFARRHLRKRMIPKVKMAASLNNRPLSSIDEYDVDYQQQLLPKENISAEEANVRILAIGACTGGPRALFSLIPKLPEDLSVPVVVVQHFPKIFTGILAKELNISSKIEVREAFDNAELAPGVVWIASGGHHCEVYREGYKMNLRTHRGPRELGERPSINMLFRSAATHYGPNAMGVVLSGCGCDGTLGAQAIKASGGQVFVQNPRSSLAPEMPLNVIRAGATKQYFDIHELAEQIINNIAEMENETVRVGPIPLF